MMQYDPGPERRLAINASKLIAELSSDQSAAGRLIRRKGHQDMNVVRLTVDVEQLAAPVHHGARHRHATLRMVQRGGAAYAASVLGSPQDSACVGEEHTRCQPVASASALLKLADWQRERSRVS